MSRSFFTTLIAGLILSCRLAAAGEAVDARAAMQAAVRADWEAQELRCGRVPQSPAAINAALQRTRALLEDLRQTGVTELTSDAAALQRLAERAGCAGSMNEASRRELYDEIRTLGRDVAFKNPLVASQPILFMKRHRAVGYMPYEYLGWYYAYGYDPTNGAKDPRFRTPPTGGGIFVLERPGRSMRIKELTAGQFPAGHFVTLSLSFDAQTVYFAFADPTGQDPYTLPHYQQTTAQPRVKYNSFHIYAMDADGRNLRQLTDGPNDDFDPCPLPDGGIAFESTRTVGTWRCPTSNCEFSTSGWTRTCPFSAPMKSTTSQPNGKALRSSPHHSSEPQRGQHIPK